MHFKSARLIFDTKMQQGDTVDDYVAKMQHLAKTIKADEKNGKICHFEWAIAPHF